MNRRQLLQRLAAAGLLSAGGVPGFMQRALAAGNDPITPGLREIRGTVTVNGAPAVAGQLIKPGDTVVTGADARAIYVIEQNAFLQRRNSTVSFGDSLKDYLRVLNGRLLSVFGRGDHNIRTASSTLGIRGTALYIETGDVHRAAGPDGKPRDIDYFCLCYGEAEVTPTAAPSQQDVLTSIHHDKPLYILNDKTVPAAMVRAKMQNHNDSELALLESLVGRTPSFSGMDIPVRSCRS